MRLLNRTLKVWHGLVGAIMALVLAIAGTAIATGVGSGGGAGKVSLGTTHGYTYRAQDFIAGNQAETQGVVGCGRHQVVVGGGALGASSSALELNSSYPHDDGDADEVPDGWAVFIDNEGMSDHDATVYAVCKKVG